MHEQESTACEFNAIGVTLDCADPFNDKSNVPPLGTVGIRQHLTSHLDLFGSAGFDNAHATLL